MKRLLIITMICVSAIAVSAQHHLGLQLGFAQPITRLNAPETKATLDPTPYNGFKIGMVYDATFSYGLGVSLGFNYTFGANNTDWVKQIITQPVEYPKIRSKAQYHQLEIPIDLQYKFEIAKHTWIILYTGPTLQYGLTMKNSWYINTGKEIYRNIQEELYSQDDMEDYALKHFNVTWGIGAGFQFQQFFLRGGYDFGLINPYKANQFDYTEANGGNPRTRGRFDQWQIKLGMYLWQSRR